MSISSSIRAVFGHFQNLNLLALLHGPPAIWQEPSNEEIQAASAW